MGWGRRIFYAVPLLWLILFFLLPFFFVFKISFAEAVIAQPPYTPLWIETSDGGLSLQVSLFNYHFLIKDALYLLSYLTSLKMAFVSTLFCLLLG
jgi:putrescine transport system permease protein